VHSESWTGIPERSTAVTRRAAYPISLLNSNKVLLLTGEQTPRPRSGNNNIEYKWEQKAKKQWIIAFREHQFGWTLDLTSDTSNSRNNRLRLNQLTTAKSPTSEPLYHSPLILIWSKTIILLFCVHNLRKTTCPLHMKVHWNQRLRLVKSKAGARNKAQ